METDKKKKLLFAGIFAGLLLCVLIALAATAARNNINATAKLAVYYYNATTGMLETEEHPMPEGDVNTRLDATINTMRESPRNTLLTNILPDDTLLLGYTLDGDVLEVAFSPAYNDLLPLDEALMRMAFVWTITELPFVEQVLFTVNGEELYTARGVPLGLANRDNVDIYPEISPERIAARPLTLYLINAEGNALLPVERGNTNVAVGIGQTEKFIVQQLIDGPVEEGYISAIPIETKIREVSTQDNICYVNLSSDFTTRFTGNQTLAKLTIYSIVHSIIDNVSNVKRVQFLIESELVDQFQGIPDFNRPFEKDETLVAATAAVIE